MLTADYIMQSGGKMQIEGKLQTKDFCYYLFSIIIIESQS